MADAFKSPEKGARKTGSYINALGAIVSLGLIAGVGVWGYKIIVRDVSGVPVVRSMPGQMRVAPENPGGDLALNEGLAVNDVAAIGEASAPEDRLVLAPPQTEITNEDITARLNRQDDAEAADAELVVSEASEVETVVALQEVTPSDTPMTAEEILALADQIAGDAAPLTDIAPAETEVSAIVAEIVEEEPLTEVISTSIPGVTTSLRPTLRPARAAVSPVIPISSDAAAVDAAVSGAVEENLLTAISIPAGTRLVQLGAFDNPELAASEWTRIGTKFSELMYGKERVIQEASSGGRVFFRLRAIGFEDISDARRFCSALVAENTDCIPVLAR